MWELIKPLAEVAGFLAALAGIIMIMAFFLKVEDE
ncbi:hypothetical protein [Citrobacter phage Tr1]|nr:hypothetical protein [Citrobacter phage Tr1]